MDVKHSINPLFKSRTLTEAGQQHAEDIRLAFTQCLERVSVYLQDGREMSLVRTKLEEASFYAIKALAFGHAAEDAQPKTKGAGPGGCDVDPGDPRFKAND
jgi:hypothetical protein